MTTTIFLPMLPNSANHHGNHHGNHHSVPRRCTSFGWNLRASSTSCLRAVCCPPPVLSTPCNSTTEHRVATPPPAPIPAPAPTPAPVTIAPLAPFPYTQSATCLIDHQWFPHIIDGILSYASVPALQAFGATSKHYHDLLTPTVYEHGVADYDPTVPSSTGLYVRDMNVNASTKSGQMPTPVTSCKGLAPVPKAAFKNLVHMRTLDVVGPFVPPSLRPPPFNIRNRSRLPAGSNPFGATLRTVRIKPKNGRATSNFPPAPTLVLFGDFKFFARITPKGITKVVHNNPNLADLKTINSFHREYEGVVPHVVINFGSWVDKQVPGSQVPLGAPDHNRAFVLAMATILLASRRGRRVTIVGLEKVDPKWLGLDMNIPEEELRELDGWESYSPIVNRFRKFLIGNVDYNISNVRGVILGRVEDVLQDVEFLTCDEYAATLSEEDLIAETLA